ncbi:MAG: hypothetical protein LC107_11830 [Chitinophagales bacterium]|nr:hypothetical protein [Chitinophagales bacterium]
MIRVVTILLISIVAGSGFAQIIPAGIGKTNQGSAFAFCIKQDLDTIKNHGWLSSSYIALSRISTLSEQKPFSHPGIFIVEQEFYNQFHQNWEHTLALSYRKQYEYTDDPPYEKGDPEYKHEIRVYGRLSYLYASKWVDITPTFRQEVSKFLTPDFENFSEHLRLRSRVRLKFTFHLTQDKLHRFLIYSEQLFSTSQSHEDKTWSKFRYKDSRFAVYYSLSPVQLPLTFNFGIMGNLIGTESPHLSKYYAFDIIWKNPFSQK